MEEIEVPDSLREIAKIIRKDWKKVNYAAEPYLSAMQAIDSIEDNFVADSGRGVVVYFLANSQTWKGQTARTIKRVLNKMVKKSRKKI